MMRVSDSALLRPLSLIERIIHVRLACTPDGFCPEELSQKGGVT